MLDFILAIVRRLLISRPSFEVKWTSAWSNPSKPEDDKRFISPDPQRTKLFAIQQAAISLLEAESRISFLPEDRFVAGIDEWDEIPEDRWLVQERKPNVFESPVNTWIVNLVPFLRRHASVGGNADVVLDRLAVGMGATHLNVLEEIITKDLQQWNDVDPHSQYYEATSLSQEQWQLRFPTHT